MSKRPKEYLSEFNWSKENDPEDFIVEINNKDLQYGRLRSFTMGFIAGSVAIYILIYALIYYSFYTY